MHLFESLYESTYIRAQKILVILLQYLYLDLSTRNLMFSKQKETPIVELWSESLQWKMTEHKDSSILKYLDTYAISEERLRPNLYFITLHMFLVSHLPLGNLSISIYWTFNSIAVQYSGWRWSVWQFVSVWRRQPTESNNIKYIIHWLQWYLRTMEKFSNMLWRQWITNGKVMITS